MNNYIQAVAKVVCDKLTSYFSMQAKSKVTTLKGPAQENSYNCGIFTIIAIECVIQHLETHNTLDNFTFPCVTQLDCIKKRSYMGYIAKNIYNIPQEVIRSLMTSYTPHSTYSQTMVSIINGKMKTKKVQKTNINTKKDANIMEQSEQCIINLPKNLAYLKLKNTEKK